MIDPKGPVAQIFYFWAEPVPQKGGHRGGGALPKEAVGPWVWCSLEMVTDATPATATVARIVTARSRFIDVLLFAEDLFQI
jgi:hypothetical protein